MNRTSLKPDPSVTTRQNVVVTQQETVVTRTNKFNGVSNPEPDFSNITEKELYARLAADSSHQSEYNGDDYAYTSGPVDLGTNGDIAQLHSQLNPTDVELLYSRLGDNGLADVDNLEPLNNDQQTLHARLIGAELERQGYKDGE